MLVRSVLAHASQLYVIPQQDAEECKRLALRFMHRPRFWIHGKEGHAFFPAGNDMGLKAIPKSPAEIAWPSHSMAAPCSFQTTVPEFNNWLEPLAMDQSPTSDAMLSWGHHL